MSDPTFNTAVLQGCLDRMRAGERAAADDLLRAVEHRLQKLATRMIRGFPNVRGLADSDDVLQNSLIRLLPHAARSSNQRRRAISSTSRPCTFAANCSISRDGPRGRRRCRSNRGFV